MAVDLRRYAGKMIANRIEGDEEVQHDGITRCDGV